MSDLKPLYIIGAGTAVINDIAGDCTAVGSPAKAVKCHTDKSEGVKSNFHLSSEKICQARIVYILQFRGAA